jgi:hypothetical protein
LSGALALNFNPGLSVAMNLLLLECLISVEHLMPLKVLFISLFSVYFLNFLLKN